MEDLMGNAEIRAKIERMASKTSSIPGRDKIINFRTINAIALVLTMFDWIKSLTNKFQDMLFERVNISIPNNDNCLHLMDLLYRKKLLRPIYISGTKKVFHSAESYIRSLQKIQLVPYGGFEFLNRWVLCFDGSYSPMWVHYSGKEIDIKYFRFTVNAKRLVEKIIKLFNDEVFSPITDDDSESRFTIIRISGTIGNTKGDTKIARRQSGNEVQEEIMDDGEWQGDDTNNIIKFEVIGFDKNDIGQPRNRGAIERMSLKKHVLDAVKEAVAWKTHEKWFKEKKIPWKKGWMLHGKPGTGKTSFVRSLGQKLDLPIFVIDLSTMTNKDLADAWNYMLGYSPCIALIEDIDAVFNLRENVSQHPEALTFDCFLNCVDGVINTDGIFTMITTNDISKLDPAIAGIAENNADMTTRPGRIDRAILFDELDKAGREKMAEYLLDGFNKDKWEQIVEEGMKDTGAQFQERCCRLAVRLFWENPDIIVERGA
jgi:hypothetical protein